MSQRISMLTLLALAGTTACGAESGEPDPEGPSPTGGRVGASGETSTGGAVGNTGGAGGQAPERHTFPDCEAGDNDDLCDPLGFPFVTHAFAHSYCAECTAPGGSLAFGQPEPGTLCLTGDIDSEQEEESGGEGGIILGFPVFSSVNLSPTHQTIVERFNATALGITQVRFTLERPPPGGLFLWADTLISDECDGGALGDCSSGLFRVKERITEEGSVTVPFADFIHDFGMEFDPRSLFSMAFDADPGPVDYCLSDFEFLDADGEVVAPP